MCDITWYLQHGLVFKWCCFIHCLPVQPVDVCVRVDAMDSHSPKEVLLVTKVVNVLLIVKISREEGGVVLLCFALYWCFFFTSILKEFNLYIQ